MYGHNHPQPTATLLSHRATAITDDGVKNNLAETMSSTSPFVLSHSDSSSISEALPNLNEADLFLFTVNSPAISPLNLFAVYR